MASVTALKKHPIVARKTAGVSKYTVHQEGKKYHLIHSAGPGSEHIGTYPSAHAAGVATKKHVFRYGKASDRADKSITPTTGVENMNFEDIFKSDVGAHKCPNCQSDLLIAKSENGLVIKARKKKKGGKLDIGNTMEPHKGGKTGSMIKPGPKGASMGGGVQRRATQPSNPTVEKSLFPMRKSFAAVTYDGSTDALLAKSIETSGVPGIPPQRNFALEQEQALRKGPPPPKKGDDDSESSESESSTDEESSEVTSDEESSTDE